MTDITTITDITQLYSLYNITKNENANLQKSMDDANGKETTDNRMSAYRTIQVDNYARYNLYLFYIYFIFLFIVIVLLFMSKKKIGMYSKILFIILFVLYPFIINYLENGLMKLYVWLNKLFGI
jgi:hypothetical protein